MSEASDQLQIPEDALRLVLEPTELDILLLMWAEELRTAKSVQRKLEALSRHDGLSSDGIRAIMRRMAERGVLLREREGLADVYTPAQSREECTGHIVRRALQALVLQAPNPEAATEELIGLIERASPGDVDRISDLILAGLRADSTPDNPVRAEMDQLMQRMRPTARRPARLPVWLERLRFDTLPTTRELLESLAAQHPQTVVDELAGLLAFTAPELARQISLNLTVRGATAAYERQKQLQATATPAAHIHQHIASAAGALLLPRGEPWGRALGWWQRAAQLGPALPLGLAADLGELLSGTLGTSGATRPEGGDSATYLAFLDAAAATSAAQAAASFGLGDAGVAALLAHLARGAPVPEVYRLPRGLDLADVTATLAGALPPPAGTPPAAYPPELRAHLLARLRALTPAEVQLLHTLGADLPGAADLADLRALTDLLTLPALDHQVLDTLLTLLPALAETAPGPAAQSYAVDGVAGLARSGTLDAVLPSEWALPDTLVASRYVNGELLYYGRERPPERRPPLLLLLVQAGDAMAGDPEVLARAAALALARRAAAQGAVVQGAFFDTRLHPPQGLTRPREVAAFVRHGGRGGVDVARVAAQALTHVQAQAGQHAQVAVQWVLHADAGVEQVGRVRGLAGRLRGSAGVGALFVAPGATPEAPALAGVLAGRWVALGSAVLHEAAARAQAAQALRQLARPGVRERLSVEPAPPKRRVVGVQRQPPPDPAAPLLAAQRWDDALAALAPRARTQDRAALALLVWMVEGRALPAYLAGPAAPTTLPPLDVRRQAAALLGEVGDPRLLDPATGEAPLGSYWCEIEAGPFWYGAYLETDRQAKANATLRAVTLPHRFRIGRYTVTNAEYRRFVDAGGYHERGWWTEEGWRYLQPGSERWFEDNDTRITEPRFWNDERYNQPNQPVVAVSWYEATAYCEWLTAEGRAARWLAANEAIRLPTSLEWERGARGTDQRPYPWGEHEPTPEHANYQATGIVRPVAVGCFPTGAAACGALDMAGNVMEWMAISMGAMSEVDPEKDFTPRDGVLLSYSMYNNQSEQLFCGARNGVNPYYWNVVVSFRLVQSLASRF